MLIAQITDPHVAPRGEKAFGKVDTNARLAGAVAHLNALSPRPDVVLLTGDLTNTPKPGEIEMLAELLAPLAIPCRLLPGNHDDRAALRAAFPDAGLPMEGEFLHHAVEDHPLRVLMLDTQVAGRPHGLMCEARLAWLADRLDEAPERPTLIAMHHPPFLSGMAGLDKLRCFGTEGLARVLEGRGNVVGIVCGHLHRPVTARFAGLPAVCAPSTAHQFALTLDPAAPYRWTTEPPAVALHSWTPETGLVSHLSYVGDYPPHPYD